MQKKKMISLGMVVVGCPVVMSFADMPRFSIVPVPSIDGEPESDGAPVPLGCGADSLFLGRDWVPAKTGGNEARGIIWRIGEDPIDLAGSSWKTAYPSDVTDDGWIVGKGVPWTGTDCDSNNNLQHIFLRSPNGVFYDIYDSGDCDKRISIADMSETKSVLFSQYTIPETLEKRPYVVHADGTVVSLPIPSAAEWMYELSDISPDGSVVTAVFIGDSGQIPVRWVDGELEVLSVPGAGLELTFEPYLTISSDNSIIATINDGSRKHPILWNADGELEYLPLPQVGVSAGAEYIFDDLIVGWMDFEGERHVVLWRLENGVVADMTTLSLGPDRSMGGWDAVGRAGDNLVIKTMDETSYTTETFVMPIEGDEMFPLHDTIVLGDISPWGPDGDEIIWTVAYCNQHSSSFMFDVLVNEGRHGGFLIERLRAGDTNGDRVVDGEDLAYLLGAWGTDDRRADLDGDGVVTGSDLSIALGDWG